MPSSPLEITFNADPRSLGVTDLDQYFGPWAVHEQRFTAMLGSLDKLDIEAHVKSQKSEASQASDDRDFQTLRGNIANIRLSGTMTKRGSSFSGGGTVRTRRQIRQAMNADEIGGILLTIESPGGAVSGTKELADDVSQANGRKPVWVFAEDIMASAAFYVGSQASKIFANEPAMVGSIGTFMVVYDFSQAFEEKGWKVNVIRAGDFKGAGIAGTEVTDQQIAEWQTLITKSNDIFLSAVQRGRGFNRAQLEQLADGRVFMASDAKDVGLIDEVSTFDAVVDQMSLEISGKRRAIMSAEIENEVPKAASLAELKAMDGASSDWVLEQLEANATVEQAQAALNRKLVAELKTEREKAEILAKENAEAAAKAKEAAQKLPGNDAVSSDGDGDDQSFGGNAVSTWNFKVQEKISAGIPRDDAPVMVDAENPGLRDAMLASYQPNPKRSLSGSGFATVGGA